MIGVTMMPSNVWQSCFGDDDVLRDVDETAREVTGVGGLERRVGETLAGAVRGDEVLQHREPFAEVRGDRRLDDFARGLGHQTAHTGQLADLLLGAAGAGVGHHEDGVELAAILLRSGASRVNISSETFSVARCQMSMILLWRSPG